MWCSGEEVGGEPPCHHAGEGAVVRGHNAPAFMPWHPWSHRFHGYFRRLPLSMEWRPVSAPFSLSSASESRKAPSTSGIIFFRNSSEHLCRLFLKRSLDDGCA